MTIHPLHRSGAAALIMVISMSAIGLAIMGSLMLISTQQLKRMGDYKASAQTFYAAEMGINNALYEIARDPTLLAIPAANFNGNNVTTNITPLGLRRQIKVDAHNTRANITRSLQIEVDTNAWAGGLDYAILSGQGGTTLENTSEVSGNKLFSNGPLSCGNNAKVNGNIVVTNIASPAKINNCEVTGDAYAKDISHSIIAGRAFGTTFTNSSATGGWAALLQTNSVFDPKTPPSLPLSDYQAAATAGGSVTCGTTPTCHPSEPPHPCVLRDGTPDIPVVIGPKKYIGELRICGGAYVKISGTVWATEKIDVAGSNARVWLDSSYGEHSGVMISGDPIDPTKGQINMKNNSIMCGSCAKQSDSCSSTAPYLCNHHSFVLIASTNNSQDDNNPAIYTANNGDAAIFFAPNGVVRLYNGNTLKNLTGWRVYLDQGAKVVYDNNLGFFSTTPSTIQALSPVLNSWTEL